MNDPLTQSDYEGMLRLWERHSQRLTESSTKSTPPPTCCDGNGCDVCDNDCNDE